MSNITLVIKRALEELEKMPGRLQRKKVEWLIAQVAAEAFNAGVKEASHG